MFGDDFEKQCKLGCWGIGLIAGIAALYLTAGQAGFLPAVFMGVALGVFLALVLQQLFCWADEEEETSGATAGAAGNAPVGGAPKPTPLEPVGYVSPTPPEANPPKPREPKADIPEPRLPNKANPLNERGGMKRTAYSDAMAAESAEADGGATSEPVDVKAEPKAKAKPEAKAEPAAAVTPAAASKPAEAAKPAAKDAIPDYDGDGKLEGTNEGSKPEALDGPRDGKADNLKEIKGVGPKLEKMLQGMGFYHFDQIASWGAQELAWVDANLQGFKGRASRDNWVEQAKILAAGGETEFSKRVEDGDVY